MDTEVVHKERKRARRVQADEDATESKPSEYTNKVRSVLCVSVSTRLVALTQGSQTSCWIEQKDRKDAQARRLEVLQSTIEKTNRRPLFDLVIDPTSFTQVRTSSLAERRSESDPK